jgi:hypothetical protein
VLLTTGMAAACFWHLGVLKQQRWYGNNLPTVVLSTAGGQRGTGIVAELRFVNDHAQGELQEHAFMRCEAF